MSHGFVLEVASRLSAATGTYALIFLCADGKPIKVGKLGRLKLQRGYYLYVGSAFGPGGVRARIGHHLHPTPSPHWHIDYLKVHCSLRELWVDYSADKHERGWAEKIAQHPHAHIPLIGFGASDLRTPSQLFRFARRPRTTVLAGTADPAIITVRSRN